MFPQLKQNPPLSSFLERGCSRVPPLTPPPPGETQAAALATGHRQKSPQPNLVPFHGGGIALTTSYLVGLDQAKLKFADQSSICFCHPLVSHAIVLWSLTSCCHAVAPISEVLTLRKIGGNIDSIRFTSVLFLIAWNLSLKFCSYLFLAQGYLSLALILLYIFLLGSLPMHWLFVWDMFLFMSMHWSMQSGHREERGIYGSN
jgi:hypothetical protein